MITIENLTKIFGSGDNAVIALENVSLTINDNDIFGIIGMSGAGKSTLLRCLSILETPTSGSICINGVQTTGVRGRMLLQLRREMGVVFQGYNLLMQKTVFDNIAFPLTLCKTAKEQIRERVEQLLDIVGLTDKATAYPSQLSGGQRQRVAIARALATSPNVLLCDEPTSALDSFTTKSMLELLHSINRTMGVTIVIITHEMSVVKAICNRVAVIDNSKFVECGLVSEVFESPTTNITRRLLGREEL